MCKKQRPCIPLLILFLVSTIALLLGWRSVSAMTPAGEEQWRNDNGQANGYTSSLAQHYIVGSVLRGDDADYPVAIQSIQTMLYHFEGATASVRVRAVIYRIGENGRPGALLAASEPVVIEDFYPNWVRIDFSAPVVLNDPQAFLAGIEYLEGNVGSTPSALFDSNSYIPIGKNYFSRDGGVHWIEHYDFWHSPSGVGYAMVRANVDTQVPSATDTPTPTNTSTPTITPTPTPTPVITPSPHALWPGVPIGYGKQHAMVKDAHGRLHMVYFGADQRSLYYAWTDDGTHWQPPLAERHPFYVFDETGGGGALALDPDGESLHLIIGQDASTTHPDGGINGALYFRYDHGRWLEGTKISSYSYGHNLAVDAQGGVHVVWSDRSIWHRYRTPSGQWQPAHIIAFNGWHPDIDIGPNGDIHVVYNSNLLCCDTNAEVYHLVSKDNGVTWSTAQRLTYDDQWTGSAAGAIDGHGVYHVLYLKKASWEGDLYYLSISPDGEQSGAKRLMKGVMTGTTGAESASMNADAAGNLAAFFYCNLAGDSRTVCLLAKDAQTGWQDVRMLDVMDGLAMSPSIAGGRLDMSGIDVTWGYQGRIYYRHITDITIKPTPTPTPTPTATPGPYHVRVMSDSGAQVDNALVYKNGVFAGRTRDDGVLNFDSLAPGDEIVALAPLPLDISRLSGGTQRSQHDRDIVGDEPVEPWAFRIYLTNMRQSPDLGPQPPNPIQEGDSGERIVTVYRNSPLILLNLTVSIEWDADACYLNELEQGFRSASRFLYDITDGQMVLGRVAIFDKGRHWADADIRIAANNRIVPHAAVSGVSASRHDFNVRLGPLWNGSTARLTDDGKKGWWGNETGWQTIVHELGHYVLGLYDEYVHYIEENGVPREEQDVYCTHRAGDLNAPRAENRASIMDNEHLASELADVGLSALWNERCTHTEQWDRSGGQSDWDTLLARFSAAGETMVEACQPGMQPTAPYCLWRPASRGQVLPQPTPDLPLHYPPPLPRIVMQADDEGAPRRRLSVQWQGQPPARGSLSLRVAIEQEVNGQRRYIEQGFVNSYSWNTDLFGVEKGAILHINAIDRSIQASIPVTNTADIRLALSYLPGMMATDSASASALSLAPRSDGQGLEVTVLHAPADAAQIAYWVADIGPEYVQLKRFGDTATATIPVDFRFRAGGVVQVMDASGQPLGPALTAHFWGRGLAALAPAEIFSPDGRVRFYIPNGAVAHDTFVVVSVLGAAPGAWSQEWAALGPIYEIRYPQGVDAPRARLLLRPDPSLGWSETARLLAVLSSRNNATSWKALDGIQSLTDGSGFAIPWEEGYLALAGRMQPSLFLPLIRQ